MQANSEQYNGKISLRIPKSLHRELVEEAAKEGVSLNQYALYRLAHFAPPSYNDDTIQAMHDVDAGVGLSKTYHKASDMFADILNGDDNA